MISAGVPFGAPIPKSARLVARYGVAHGRELRQGPSSASAVVTARARSLPARMCSMRGRYIVEHHLHLTAEQIVMAGPAPRYGTCCMLMPVIILNSSPAMCGDVPVARKIDFAGLALA